MEIEEIKQEIVFLKESIATEKTLRDTALLNRDIVLAEKLTDGINQKDAELGRLRAAPSVSSRICFWVDIFNCLIIIFYLTHSYSISH